MAASRWERDTVALAREGRPGAYAKLVQRYTEPIGHAVQNIVRDEDRACDVTQQAFVSAYEHLDSYDPRHRFFSWIFRIALNEALNAARRSRRCCRLDGMEMPDPDPSPEELLIAQERAAGLRRALKELPGKYQHLVILRYFLDLPYADIACILDLPATTVKSRLHTALGLLRVAWERREDGLLCDGGRGPGHDGQLTESRLSGIIPGSRSDRTVA